MRTMIAGLMTFLLLSTLSGCNSEMSNARAYMISGPIYTGTVNGLSTLRVLGKIDDDQYREIEEFRGTAWVLLEKMRMRAMTDGPGKAGSTLQLFNQALDMLIQSKLQAEGGKLPAAEDDKGPPATDVSNVPARPPPPPRNLVRGGFSYN